MAKSSNTTKKTTVALVGAETLLGREIEEVLKERNPEMTVRAFAANAEGNFGEEEGEAVYVKPFTAEDAQSAKAIVIAGALEGAQKAYELVKANGGGTPIFDCTGLLSDEPEARIVAPGVGLGDMDAWLFEVAHPAANALAMVLSRLAAHQPVKQAIAHIFEPVSERGQKGISELQKQTTSLLSFKPLDKTVFDAQVSFNMLSRYGEEAASKLTGVEQRIARDVATLLSRADKPSAIPVPSVRVVHAPVFHGYSISLWVEFSATANAQAVAQGLVSADIEVRTGEQEAPDNVGAASQSGLMAGDIRVDENNPRAVWLWIVGDNLRLTADAVADLISAATVTIQ